MRLKIVLENNEVSLPLNYQSMIQGFIYNIFDHHGYGKFLHEEGYKEGKRIFKLFNFSNLFGNYKVENGRIYFNSDIAFYVGSYSEEFMHAIYDFLIGNSFISLNNVIFKVKGLYFEDLDYFRGEKEISIRTLSPIVTYQTVGKYVTYFKPSDKEFSNFCFINLLEKNKALKNPIHELNFKVCEVMKEKKRLVKFKNTFYEAYIAEMKICVNYETLLLIYNTGLSSKGPAGFGMIEVIK